MSSFKLADAIDLDSNPPSSMKIKEIRQDLESMGIGTKSFIEKSEFVDALIEARKERKAPGGDENAPGSGDDEEGPSYFICLDGSNDTDGPLRRDCVCRGDDAGYAHLKCLVEYAKSESMKLNKQLLPSEVATLRNRFTMSNPGDRKKKKRKATRRALFRTIIAWLRQVEVVVTGFKEGRCSCQVMGSPCCA